MSEPRLLTTATDVAWAAAPNTLSLYAGTSLPDPVTAVSAFVHHQQHLLLVRVASRGWDLPGGRLEAGERATDALPREVREEAGLDITGRAAGLVGYQHLHHQGPRPRGSRWPHPHTYQAFFAVPAGHRSALATEVPDEIEDAAWVPFAQVADRTGPRSWSPLFEHVRAHLGAPTPPR